MRYGLVFLMLWSSMAFAQAPAEVPKPEPFGFVFGQGSPGQKYGCAAPEDGLVRCTTAPRPVSAVAGGYMLLLADNKLVRVAGLIDIENDETGVKTRAQFDQLAGALKAKYGNPKHEFDFLHVGSIWTDPQYFGMSLYKEQRSLATVWEVNGVRIVLRAVAYRPSKILLGITYEDMAWAEGQSKKTSASDAQAL